MSQNTHYEDFFRAAFDRVSDQQFRPFGYQTKLASDAWPDLLEVPTGMGKTAAVVLAWLWKRGWRQSERAQMPDQQTPCRLVYCLPMRVLVEQTHRNVEGWLKNLGICGEPGQGKVSVHLLMGGSEDVAQATWAEHPEEDMILIGTQDMLLSAALNRAYATYPSQWPVQFGLLNVDTFWVMDEVQLMGPGRTTSVQLQHFFEQLGACPRQHKEIPLGRRTLWMSATLGQTGPAMPDWTATPEVKETNRTFARYSPQRNELDATRLDAPKSLQNKPNWTYESDDLHHTIIDEACQSDDRLVLVFVNTVRRARELHQKLEDKIKQSSCAAAKKPELILIHSRFRKEDRDALTAKLNQSSGRRIVVSTQVLEAGVDLDADVLFTEIAPWASLIQRFGRLNRRGIKPSIGNVQQKLKIPALAVVFGIPHREVIQGRSRTPVRQDEVAPYEEDAIANARRFIDDIVNNHKGSVSPATLQRVPAPLVLEGPILREFILTGDLFPTDADLSGGHTDVAHYLRALDRDVDCHVLWRELPGGKNQNALPPDEQPPIHRDELCPVPFFEAKEAFNGKRVWILAYSLEGRRRTATWRETRASDIKSGDTVMVPLEYGCYSDQSGWLGKDDKPDRWISVGQDAEGRAARGWKDSQGGFTVIDYHVDPERGFGGDPRSTWKRRQRDWMTLGDHLQKAQSASQGLVNALNLKGSTAAAVIEADLWHDLGKALERQKNGAWEPIFQNMLIDQGMSYPPHPQKGVLYAKSKPKPGGSGSGDKNTSHDEDRFRHEVASALAYLMHANKTAASDPLKTSLTAYLILAHHGKVRCMPAPWDEERSDDWNGVRPGDRIVPFQIPQTSLQWTTQGALDLSLFLPAPNRPGWQGRVALLLEHYGPFYLAYLEALVRVADWRAS
ncbi:MAG: CRISPR-associated helicase Cas3' [Nevskia sp.]|nr:CRISPR-associated helicase Cas3' [Nevskia sp.]